MIMFLRRVLGLDHKRNRACALRDVIEETQETNRRLNPDATPKHEQTIARYINKLAANIEQATRD